MQQPGPFGPQNTPYTPGMPPAAATDVRTKTDGPTKQTKREARMSRRTVGILAVLLGLVAFALILSTFAPEPAPDETYVIRARTQIPALQPITADQLEAVAVDPDTVEPDTITGSTAEEALAYVTGQTLFQDETGKEYPEYEIVGKFPVVPVLRGQQIRMTVFTPQLQPAVPLAPNERLLSLEVPIANAVSGQLRVNDRVDVLVVRAGEVHILASNIEIVAVSADQSAIQSAAQRQTSAEGRDLSAGDILPTDPIPGVYTLRLTDIESLKVAAAATDDDVLLVYRAPGSTNLEQTTYSLDDLFDGEILDQPAATTPAP